MRKSYQVNADLFLRVIVAPYKILPTGKYFSLAGSVVFSARTPQVHQLEPGTERSTYKLPEI